MMLDIVISNGDGVAMQGVVRCEVAVTGKRGMTSACGGADHAARLRAGDERGSRDKAGRG